MNKVYVDIEHQIPASEMKKFVDLSEVWDKSLQETIEICMYEKRDEYLDQFKNNVPEEEQKSELNTVTTEATERVETETISDTTS